MSRSRVLPYRRVDRPRSRGRILHPGSVEFATHPILGLCHPGTATGAATPGAAEDPVAMPFAISDPIVITQFGVQIGTAPGGTFDVGVYSSQLMKVVTTGARSNTAGSSVQWEDVTDTVLPRGRYYLVFNRSANTSQQYIWTTSFSAAYMAWVGMVESSTNQYPLPAVLTNMVPCTNYTRIPMCMIATKTPYTNEDPP